MAQTKREFRGPVDRMAAWIYRSLGGHAPYLILKRLGIATPRRRPEFFAVSHLLRTMPQVPGSVLECGAYQGATLLGMAHILRARGSSSRVYGLDSFEGFPEPTPEDARADGSFDPEVKKGGLGDASYENLLERIRLLGLENQVTLIKGFFEDTLPLLNDERFSLVHIDCDLYASHMTCLEFVYPRMCSGGFIVFDEYDSFLYTGARRAIDEFFLGKPETLQHLPDVSMEGKDPHDLHRQGVRHYVQIRDRRS